MEKNILEFIEEIQSDARYDSFDEAAVKQGIVLKLLSLLGWDPFDINQIKPEYVVEDGRVDFSLLHKNSSMVFIGVKKGTDALTEYQEELSDYAVQDEVPLVVLTDGIVWWFCLPLLEGSAEEKRIYAMNVNERKAEELAQSFDIFLSKENVQSGKAVKAAEEIHNARKKLHLIRESLPKAWEKVLSEPEKWLHEILAQATNELCGYMPDEETTKKFIASQIDAKAAIAGILKQKVEAHPEQDKAIAPKSKKAAVKKDEFKGKSIVSFSLKGKEHKVESWTGMLLKVCEIIAQENQDDFDTVLTLLGTNREYFSRNPYELLTCEKVPGTQIYVDVNLSPIGVVVLSHRVLSLFGYKEKDLSVKTK
ncbi:MAG: restriction endonuclease subunit R [Deltaproteobacteria bacterium]|nr:restriction endonuclease subunit R [Deltaproteobacteria bacterium]